jgi:L-arabinose isomerase
MPLSEKEFKIGLLVTALLEDRFNKTGHMRGEAQRVTGLYEEKLKKFGRVVNPGFFEYEDEAVRAASKLKSEDVDVIVFIELAYQKGLIPMRALLQLDVPIIIWNSQLVDEFGEDADFDLIMVNSGMAGLPEASSSLIRANKRFWVVTGSINDEIALRDLEEYLRAARAVSRLKNSRIGIIGHPYEGMTDLMQDNFAVMEQFGCSSWPIDHDEIISAYLETSEKEGKNLIEEEKALGRNIEVEDEMMLRSARLALALEKVVKGYSLDAVAEFDQVAMAMLVLEEVAGHATFLEHYILDYKRDQMFNSHDGHGNPALADPKHGVRIVPTIYYEGVHGFGASFNYSYKPGDFTLFSIGSIGASRFQFITSEGQNLEMKPRDIAAPQTFFKWSGGDIRLFAEEWLYAAPSHHHTGAYGRLNGALSKTADMLGVDCVII